MAPDHCEVWTSWPPRDSSVGKEPICNAEEPGSIPGLGRSAGEGIDYPLQNSWASLAAQLVKNPPAMWETWVGKIPWRTERLPTPLFWPGEFHGLYSPWGHKQLDMTEGLSLHFISSKKESYSNAGHDLQNWCCNKIQEKLNSKDCDLKFNSQVNLAVIALIFIQQV